MVVFRVFFVMTAVVPALYFLLRLARRRGASDQWTVFLVGLVFLGLLVWAGATVIAISTAFGLGSTGLLVVTCLVFYPGMVLIEWFGAVDAAIERRDRGFTAEAEAETRD